MSKISFLASLLVPLFAVPAIVAVGYFLALIGIVLIPLVGAVALLACFYHLISKENRLANVQMENAEEFAPNVIDLKKYIDAHEYDQDIFMAS